MKKKTTVAKVHPRKLARQMAKAQLDAAKVTGYNKERIGMDGKKMPSVFARNWRLLSMKAAGVSIEKKGKA